MNEKRGHSTGGEYSVWKERLSGNLGLLMMDINMDTGDTDAYSAWMGSDGVERGGFLSIPQKEGSQG